MSHTQQTIRFCTSRDGVRIAFATGGAGPPLVWVPHWVHNLKCDADSPVWGPWLSALSRRHAVIRYDWRGCGLSDRDGVEFSFERQIDDLEAVIAAAGIKRFVLVGMANGAGVGMAYAVRHPEHVSHLVLYGSWTRGRLVRSATRAQAAEARTQLKVIELGWPNENPGYGQFFTSLHLPDASAEQMQSYNDQLRLTTSPSNAVAILKAFFDTDLREIAPQVRCPTLVLHARGESVVEFDEGRTVAALISGARFVPLASRNHVLLSTEPAWQQLVEEIDTFLPSSRETSIDTPELDLDELTARERAILEIIAQGVDNNGIAKRLGISEKTVRNQVSIILDKLGIEGRLQAVVRAREAGLGRKSIESDAQSD